MMKKSTIEPIRTSSAINTKTEDCFLNSSSLGIADSMILSSSDMQLGIQFKILGLMVGLGRLNRDLKCLTAALAMFSFLWIHFPYDS